MNFETGSYIGHLINYGNIATNILGKSSIWAANNGVGGIGKITNYGAMGGISYGGNNNSLTALTLNSLGLIMKGMNTNPNLQVTNNTILIQNYTIMIRENATTFNSFSGYNNNTTAQTNNSHLAMEVINNGNISFKDKNSRIAFDFGRNFELGVAYSIDKVATNTNGQSYSALGVDFNRLTTRNDIYYLIKQGNNFIVKANPNYSTIGMLYKSNIKTMNNFFFQSNNMIYPHKYKKKKRLGANGVNPNMNPSAPSNYRRVRGISNLFRNPHNIYIDSSPLRDIDSSIESIAWQSMNNNTTNESNESKSNSNESQWIASYSTNTRNDDSITTSSLRDSTPTRHSELSLESEESMNLNNSLDLNSNLDLDSFALDSSLIAFAQNDEVESNPNDNAIIANPNNNTLDSSLNESALADSNQFTNNYYANLPIQSNELFFYDNEWLLARDNANARKVNMDYTHSVKAVNNSNVSKDAYYNKGAYRNKIITNDTRTNEINQYQSTNRQGNVSRTPNQNNRHLANQSNNSPCGSYKCIYIYRPQQPQPKVEPKVEPKPQPKPEPKVEPKPQPKPIQVIRPTMPPPPKVEPKVEPKPEPKVVKVEPKPTPPKPKVIIQDPYYFVLTPYAGHNFFYEAGKYHISGPEYGFITAFSGKLDDDNILGTHFAFSYSNLTDEVEVFDLKSMNIMLGLNYKLDNLVNDTYLKARIDAFYFLNTISSRMVLNLKPNNLAFGASVAYGKEWYLGTDEILGLEGGISYKALYGNNFNIEALDKSYVDTFKNALYNMLYVDLGVNYDKYFETSVGRWGLDTGLGVRGNITANMLARSRVDAMDGTRKLTMTLDNDRFIAYANIGGSYLLEKKDFDMEFSLAYYGNFGDRTMSNAGGFEWRVYW